MTTIAREMDSGAQTTRDILAHEPFLRALARGLQRCDADVDDLVQETLLRAYRARERFQRGTSLRAWLATILRRKHLTDRLTQKRRHTDTWTDVAITGERFESPEPSVHGTIHDVYRTALERLDERVRHAFDDLPDSFRECFILYALGGMSYEEISQRLGIPRGTVMSRLHRARMRLREVVYSVEPRLHRTAG
jgi:RNA polymerase sigma-70 factor, ECF subfamily